MDCRGLERSYRCVSRIYIYILIKLNVVRSNIFKWRNNFDDVIKDEKQQKKKNKKRKKIEII